MPPSQQSKAPNGSPVEWLIEQLGILAVAKGAPQTAERLAINAADLADIPQETMREVFKRARLEKTFGYPQVSDLREMAGLGGEGEGFAAWDFVQTILTRHLHRSGAEGYALCDGTGPIEWDLDNPDPKKRARAKRIPLPEIPPEIERAVRLCGGWARLKELDDEELPWAKKEFLAAVASYDATTMASDRLLSAATAGMAKQLAEAQQLAPAKRMLPAPAVDEEADVYAEIAAKEAGAGPMPELLPRMVGQDLTDEEWEARKPSGWCSRRRLFHS